ncbi:MAG: ABC transporter permease [Candidatus Omnitrophica bacterium]|nr:putative multidrug ABC transporter permease YbhS [bacterium]NUN97867.1 ABC transporter permease [Candidatus Omnitrophota bacterium]
MILRGLSAIMYKETVQIRRDPSTRFVFLIPVIQTIIFGYAIDMDIQHIRTIVHDMDRSAESRRLVESLANTQTFDVVEEVHGDLEVHRRIVAGTARVGVIVPPDFSAKILRGEKATVQVLVDGSDSSVATNAVQTALGVGYLQALQRAGVTPETASIEVRPRVLFNPDLESSHFYVPGLIGIILQVVTVFLTAFAIVRERERGTLEQLVVTPVSKGALILGKLVPYCVIGMVQTLFVLLLMRWVFGVPVEGDVFLLLSLSALFLLPALAMGILVSTVSSNQAQAMQMGMLIMLPSILLSGFAFPRETMPGPIYLLTFLIPVTYYVQILRGIILRGAGFWALWPQTLILAVFAVVLVVASSLRFQKRIG